MGLACARIFSIRIEEETAHTRDLSIKGNNMKNKKMAVAGISLLGSIGVISTGFAGWIISAQPQTKEGNGSITADGNVTSKSIFIKETSGFGPESDATTNAAICFAPKITTETYSWLDANNENGDEDLTAVYTVNLAISNVTTIKVYGVTLAEKDSGTKYSALSNGGLNQLGTLPAFNNNEAATAGNGDIKLAKTSGVAFTYADGVATAGVDSKDTEMSFTISINFAWGKYFNYQNPYKYYNSQKYTPALQTDATEKIGKLKDLGSNVQFALSFTVSAE